MNEETRIHRYWSIAFTISMLAICTYFTFCAKQCYQNRSERIKARLEGEWIWDQQSRTWYWRPTGATP